MRNSRRGQDAEKPMAMTERHLRAYIGLIGAGDVGYRAHIEDIDDQSRMVGSRDGGMAEVIAWARQRTGWVLVVDEPMMWAGTDPVPDDDDIRRVWSDEGEAPVGR